MAIIQYCAGFGIKVEFFNTEKDPLKITFEQFKAWFSYDFPQKNDVITLNFTIYNEQSLLIRTSVKKAIIIYSFFFIRGTVHMREQAYNGII